MKLQGFIAHISDRMVMCKGLYRADILLKFIIEESIRLNVNLSSDEAERLVLYLLLLHKCIYITELVGFFKRERVLNNRKRSSFKNAVNFVQARNYSVNRVVNINNTEILNKLEVLNELGLFKEISVEYEELVEAAQTTESNSLSLNSYNKLRRFFLNKAGLHFIEDNILKAILSFINDVWTKSSYYNASINNDSKDISNIIKALDSFTQAIVQSNKELISTLAKTQQKDSSGITSQQFLDGINLMSQAFTNNTKDLMELMLQTNRDNIQTMLKELPNIISITVKQELNDTSQETKKSDTENTSKILDSEESPPIPLNYTSKYGYWHYENNYLTWISFNCNSEFNNLRIPVNSEHAKNIGEWTLLIDAFLTATFTFKSRGYGLIITSPLLTCNVNTLNIVKLFWYLLSYIARINSLIEKGAQKNKDTLVFLLHIFDGKQWKSPNDSFYFNENITEESWIKHWSEGIRYLKDRPYNVNLLVQFEWSIYVVNSSPKRSIGPLAPRTSIKTKLGSLDIETIKNSNNSLFPYAIGFYLKDIDNPSGFNSVLKTYYLTDFLKKQDYISASRKIVNQCLQDLAKLGKGYTIYVHNLGNFDSIFLLKNLAHLFGKYNILIDNTKDVIALNTPKGFIIKDSARILPASLSDLSLIFKVPTPKGIFNHAKMNVKTLRKYKEELLEYLNKDLISLLDVIEAASIYLFKTYQIDLADTYSTSSLAMKIFRTKFLSVNIPILSDNMDHIIRTSYRGGAVQVFKQRGENLRYYDVNSLYPYSISSPIPIHFLSLLIPKEIRLETFTGFIKATIQAPVSVTPVIPHHFPKSEELEYPQGPFTGLFWAEELRYAKSVGYKLKIHLGYLFSMTNLFSTYVNHFYTLKSQVTGGERFIIKQLLNGLYGYFGRQPYNLLTSIVTESEILELLSKHPVTSTTQLTPELYLILFKPQLDTSNYRISNTRPVNTNVAIASAITSNSRIFINPFKTDPSNPCIYSDTDSVFLQHPLEPKYIGKELGQFKDELNGDIICEALFLRPKTYGFITKTGIQKVVAAGFDNKELNFSDLKRVTRGEIINTTINILLRDNLKLTLTETELTRTLTIK